MCAGDAAGYRDGRESPISGLPAISNTAPISRPEALAAKRPVVLEVKTDPEVPPLPPHITLDQAKKFSQSLAKGEPRTGEMVAGAARQLLSAILPNHQD